METESKIEIDGSVLWFEYLLDSTLLEKKLLQENSGNLVKAFKVFSLMFTGFTHN